MTLAPPGGRRRRRDDAVALAGGDAPWDARGTDDGVLATIRMLRERQSELEASEASLLDERDRAVRSEATLRTKLQQSSASVASLKQQLAAYKHKLYTAEKQRASGGDGGSGGGWDSSLASGGGLFSPGRDPYVGVDRRPSPTAPRAPPRPFGSGGWMDEGRETEEGTYEYVRDLDLARRTVEAQRTQLRTQQAEHLKCSRELRALKGKIDSLKAASEAARQGQLQAEESLSVQKVAAQAMMQRLQSRSAECTALQRQLSARAVELVHEREDTPPPTRPWRRRRA